MSPEATHYREPTTPSKEVEGTAEQSEVSKDPFENKDPEVFCKTNEITNADYLTISEGVQYTFTMDLNPEAELTGASTSTSSIVAGVSESIAESKAGLRFLASQRQTKLKSESIQFSLMVAGEYGSGKSTFINTLFGEVLSRASSTPTLVINAKYYELHDDDTSLLRFTAIDTPGFDASTDQYYWARFANFIDQQMKSVLLQKQQPVRDQVKDTRVHLCLYFISAMRDEVKFSDIKSMQELSTRVNLIPVIAKADTYDTEELQRAKARVRRAVEDNGIQLCHFIPDQRVIRKLEALYPFSLIGATEQVDINGKSVRGRKYEWGICEVDNPQHCDFTSLKSFIMEEHMLDLIESTENYFDRFREDYLYEKLKRCNQENECDGIKQYIAYSKANSADFEPFDAAFAEKGGYLTQEYTLRVRQQEDRFREWKLALMNKQEELNADITAYHQRVLHLKTEIQALESELGHDKSFASMKSFDYSTPNQTYVCSDSETSS